MFGDFLCRSVPTFGWRLVSRISRWNYDPCFTTPPHSRSQVNAPTTTVFASVLMARPSKRSFQQKEQPKEARRSKKQRGEEEALLAAIEALGVPAEGGSDRYQVQDSTNESSDESSEEECEIADGGGYRHL